MNSPVVFIFPTEHAKSHWMTERLLKKAGLKLADFDCLTADNSPLTELNSGKWKVGVVFGEDALWAVCQKREILRWFHREVPLVLNNHQMTIVPCFEPRLLLPYTVKAEESTGRKSAGMRHPPRYQGVAVAAIRKALSIAENGPTPVLATRYLEDPTPNRFREWATAQLHHLRQHGGFLSWDIETPYKIEEDDEEEFDETSREREKTIIRISFAVTEGEAASVMWLPEYMDSIRELLAYEGYHVGWNALTFDIPVVTANGVRFGGRMIDGMDAWHLLQPDLDKGLEHVTSYFTTIQPWKHLSDTMPALYSCIDSDAALRNVLGIKRELEARGLWERCLREMEIMVTLARAGQHGNTVDEAFRQAYKAELEAELYKELVAAQALVGKEFHRTKLYSRLPKHEPPTDWSEVMVFKTIKACSSCGKERVSTKHKCPNEGEWAKVDKTVEVVNYYRTEPLKDVTTLEELLEVLSTSGFNPCSADQMKRYMKANKHPVGQNYKTKKDTADVKHLQKLVKKYDGGHPIYRHTLKIRQIQKALSTYVNGLEPDEHGLIHTTYTNSTNTWRLGSRRINVQNLGKRANNPYAKKARKIIVPKPGYCFVQADSSAIEAKMVGWFMEDDKYMRLASKGVHGYVAARSLGWNVTADTWTMALNDKLKAEHKAEYDRFKMVNHATNYGATPYLVHMSDPDTFPTLNNAKQTQEFIFKELPGLPKWHHQLRVTAKKNGYLDNPWGLRFYFYDVFNYKYDPDTHELIFDHNGLPEVKLAKDAQRVIAVKPQSSAGMFMRDNLWMIGESKWRDCMPAVVSIHDGYTLEVRDDKYVIEEAAEYLIQLLTRPILEMDGLRVGCEVDIMRENFLDSEPYRIVEVE